MRTRTDIEEDYAKTHFDWERYGLLLEAILDIRDLLSQEKPENTKEEFISTL